MADATIDLLKAQFRQLRLPTMSKEFEKLARDAAASNLTFAEFLLRLTEIELAARAANAVTARIKNAAFPVLKDFDTFDFSAIPQLPKPKILELARCEWIDRKYNCCLVGGSGTGKTHVALPDWARRPAAWQVAGPLLHGGRPGQPPGEGAEASTRSIASWAQLDRMHLLICDDLG